MWQQPDPGQSWSHQEDRQHLSRLENGTFFWGQWGFGQAGTVTYISNVPRVQEGRGWNQQRTGPRPLSHWRASSCQPGNLQLHFKTPTARFRDVNLVLPGRGRPHGLESAVGGGHLLPCRFPLADEERSPASRLQLPERSLQWRWRHPPPGFLTRVSAPGHGTVLKLTAPTRALRPPQGLHWQPVLRPAWASFCEPGLERQTLLKTESAPARFEMGRPAGRCRRGRGHRWVKAWARAAAAGEDLRPELKGFCTAPQACQCIEGRWQGVKKDPSPAG